MYAGKVAIGAQGIYAGSKGDEEQGGKGSKDLDKWGGTKSVSRGAGDEMKDERGINLSPSYNRGQATRFV
ncbi:hypothetical protein EON65_16840 [archaeon]|nr:MAG: hypothetical protein EON65_16840 [archaeon]